MTEQERINEIIAMLDNFTENGGGHVNLTVEGLEGEVQMENSLSVGCCNAQSACSVPTLHQGIDDDYTVDKKGE